jgi:hypothetical protein
MPGLGSSRSGKQFPNMIEQPGVSRHVGAWSSADGLLINDNQATDMLHATGNFASGGHNRRLFQIVRIGLFFRDRLPQPLCHKLNQDLTNEA